MVALLRLLYHIRLYLLLLARVTALCLMERLILSLLMSVHPNRSLTVVVTTPRLLEHLILHAMMLVMIAVLHLLEHLLLNMLLLAIL